MIRTYLYSIIVILTLSCQSLEQPPKPEVFIEEDKMVEILTDMAFIKATKSTFRKVLETKNVNPETYILEKHNIDSIVFKQNNIWYTNQTEEYSKLITRVKDNLEAQRNKYEKLKKEEDSIKKVQDSIRKAKDTLKTNNKHEELKQNIEEEEEWVH